MNEELIEKFLTPLSPYKATGDAIRYTPLYEKIQEARRSEDESLPRGIWETAIKKADWSLVVSLCTKGLLEESKDLQLASWLVEAWTELYGLDGLSLGLEMLYRLSHTFWEDIHPHLDLIDPASRKAPYEWIDHQLSSTLLHVHITSVPTGDLKNFSFADWITIQHLETVSKKQKDPTSYLQKEAQKGLPHPLAVRVSISATPHIFYGKVLEKIQEILEKIQILEAFLAQRLANEGVSFYDLKKQLEALKNFAFQGQKITQENTAEPAISKSLPQTKTLKTPLENQSSLSELNSREKAYTYLARLAEFLMKTEPHSLTPYLLRTAIAWQNKTLLDVLQDFRQDPQALQVLLAILDKPTPRQ